MTTIRILGMTCFYGKDSPLSNWHPAPFTYKGVSFLNTEQFMMYCKAKLFKDEAIAQKILETQTPKECKELGRQVKNFDEALWNEKSANYVQIGCLAKFRQNPSLATVLLETGSTELVEASPHDTIWGVGLAVDDPRIRDKSQWRGENRLGQVLMRVRDVITFELHQQTLPDNGEGFGYCSERQPELSQTKSLESYPVPATTSPENVENDTDLVASSPVCLDAPPPIEEKSKPRVLAAPPPLIHRARRTMAPPPEMNRLSVKIKPTLKAPPVILKNIRKSS